MSKKCLFILIFSIILPISLNIEETERIEEYISYNLVFSKDNKDSKIFEYIPSCNSETNEFKNIYAQGISSIPFILAIYDDLSKIEFSETEGYVNFKYKYYIKNNITQIENKLSCNVEYYLVVYTMDYDISFLQFSIRPEVNEKIDISNLVQKSSLLFYQRNFNEEKFYYSSHETKYLLITILSLFFGNLKITEINEGEEKVIHQKPETFFSKAFKLEKDREYYIYYSSYIKSPIFFEIINEPNQSNIIKHNFKDGPIVLYGIKNDYYYEINITNYNIGDHMVLMSFGDMDNNENKLSIKYRYKNSIPDNYNDLYYKGSNYKGSNYIPLNITKQDEAIILKINLESNYEGLIVIDLFKYNYEEITDEFNEYVKGPKLLHLNSYLFNNLNSIGIQSDQSYYLKIQEITKLSNMSSYESVSIITQDYTGTINVELQTHFKDVFIFLNTDNTYAIEIKKFNYPIYYLNTNSSKRIFFELCNREDTTNELYFYSSDNIFAPIFGNFNIDLTYSKDIKKLSDLNFNNRLENIFNFNFKSPAYLKLTCDNPTMITNIRYVELDSKTKIIKLSSGEKIYLSKYEIDNYKYTLDDSLENQEIKLRVKVFGPKDGQSIQFYLNETEYNISITNPLETSYIYQTITDDLMQFNIDKNIDNDILIEIIVGSQNKDTEIIEFNNNLEPINFNVGKTYIIKFLNNFNDNLLNYSMVFSSKAECEIEISYDNIEYLVPRKVLGTGIYTYKYDLINLFKTNPYSFISENDKNSNDKLFYILITNVKTASSFLFQKPMIISFELNNLTIVPKLENSQNTYYQINIPKGDYNSLLFQIIRNEKDFEIFQMSIPHNNIEYPYRFSNKFYYSIPIDKTNPCINIYNTDNINYINIVPSKEIIYKKNKDENINLNATIQQMKNNKFKIRMKSCSYEFSPLKYKYHLIINLDEDFDCNITSIITGNTHLDEVKRQTMIDIEEEYNNLNQTFEREFDIGIKLFPNNKMSIVPFLKENNIIEFISIGKYTFNYTDDGGKDDEEEEDHEDDDKDKESDKKSDDNNNENNGRDSNNNENNDNNSTIVLLSVVGGLIIIIIIIIVVMRSRRKKENKNYSTIENSINQELNRLQDD